MKRWSVLLVCATLACQAVPAQAGPSFTVTDVSVVGDAVTVTGPVGPENTIAGPITLSSTFGTLVAWCIDLYHNVYTGGGQNLPYQIGTVTTDGSPANKTLSADQQSTIGRLAQYGQSLVGTAAGTTDALAAVQLAIWSTEYSGFSYTGASGASVSDALKKAASFSSLDAGLIALGGTQTFVTADSRAIAAVPEPASLALAGLALSGLAFARRRRRA